MRIHDQDRHRDRRFDDNSKRSPSRERNVRDDAPRGRHAPYKRQSPRDWADWAEQSDDDLY